MSQKQDKTEYLELLKRYREALEKIAEHDGINKHAIPSPMLAQIAKTALEKP